MAPPHRRALVERIQSSLPRGDRPLVRRPGLPAAADAPAGARHALDEVVGRGRALLHRREQLLGVGQPVADRDAQVQGVVHAREGHRAGAWRRRAGVWSR